MASTLLLDPTYVDGVYDELAQLTLSLDDDPLTLGPKRINGKIAESQRMVARCEHLFLEVSQRLSQFQRALRAETVGVELAKKHMLANDPTVRAERSVSDRDAAASMKLKAEVAEVNRLTSSVADLDAVMIVIKAKRSDLRNTQGRLRDQIRLCQEEIGLGSRWGSKRPGAKDIEAPVNIRSDLDEVDSLIRSVEGETHLKAARVPKNDEDDEAEETPVTLGRITPALLALTTQLPGDEVADAEDTEGGIEDPLLRLINSQMEDFVYVEQKPEYVGTIPPRVDLPCTPSKTPIEREIPPFEVRSIVNIRGLVQTCPVCQSKMVEHPSCGWVCSQEPDTHGMVSSADTRPTGTLCSECGEPQFNCWGGVSCSNGHGGAPAQEDEVPASAMGNQAAPAAATILPGRIQDTDETVDGFLAEIDLGRNLPKKSRRAQEDEDSLDIDEILSQFSR